MSVKGRSNNGRYQLASLCVCVFVLSGRMCGLLLSGSASALHGAGSERRVEDKTGSSISLHVSYSASRCGLPGACCCLQCYRVVSHTSGL